MVNFGVRFERFPFGVFLFCTVSFVSSASEDWMLSSHFPIRVEGSAVNADYRQHRQILGKTRSLRSTNNCVTPENKAGLCIAINDCTSLNRILQNNNYLDRTLILLLQRSTCGFSGDDPNVCCPLKSVLDKENENGQNVVEQFSTEKGAESSNPRSRSENVHTTLGSLTAASDIWQKVAGHQNLRLLPSFRTCGATQSVSRITGGTEAGFGTHPWIVRLGFTKNSAFQTANRRNRPVYGCGGTLINQIYILTAAHCVTKLESASKLTTIRIGEYDESSATDCKDGRCAPPVQDIDVSQIIIHRDYDKNAKSENDIALVRLKTPAQFGPFVAPICLPKNPSVFSSGSSLNTTRLTVAGWGYTSSATKKLASVLQEVEVPIITLEECIRVHKADSNIQGYIGPGRFCGGGEANKDSCQGDSGGPIMGIIPTSTQFTGQPKSIFNKMYQFGIVSLGPDPCGTKGEPGLYTKVSHFMPWILDHLQP